MANLDPRLTSEQRAEFEDVHTKLSERNRRDRVTAFWCFLALMIVLLPSTCVARHAQAADEFMGRPEDNSFALMMIVVTLGCLGSIAMCLRERR